ncbi:phage tail terminator-like protein [Devosia sp. 1635]|uniref:phage tail terminator-like protein n=1 Tax=Devosia sp. 1635 TaxID=2726066 RepID=UPI001564F543|nr:phage tail terminator-like protein [Devosia sp. 1635]
MARLAVVVAVQARLDALWTRCTVFDENSQGSTPEDGSPFLQLQFPFADAARISFGVPGANTHREEGAFRLLLNMERGTGGAQGRAWAAELEAMFLNKHFSGVETFVPSSASSDDANENGQYFTYAVAVPYRFDFLG